MDVYFIDFSGLEEASGERGDTLAGEYLNQSFGIHKEAHNLERLSRILSKDTSSAQAQSPELLRDDSS